MVEVVASDKFFVDGANILEGKRYYNNFQERDFLRDLKFPHFLCIYVAGKKGRNFQIT